MAGAPPKNRVLATVDRDTKATPETQELFDEATGRLHNLEHTDLDRDSAYRELVADIEHRSRKGTKSPYTAEHKLQVALAYVVTGSSKDSSKLTGVPAATIRTWKSISPWWPRAVEIAHMVKREGTDATYQKIQDAANREVLDRIDEGDHRLMATGEIKRVPISGKDLMTISGIARDKQSILRGQPTSITAKESDNDRLEALADKITKAVQASGRVIEGVVLKDDDN